MLRRQPPAWSPTTLDALAAGLKVVLWNGGAVALAPGICHGPAGVLLPRRGTAADLMVESRQSVLRSASSRPAAVNALEGYDPIEIVAPPEL